MSCTAEHRRRLGQNRTGNHLLRRQPHVHRAASRRRRGGKSNPCSVLTALQAVTRPASTAPWNLRLPAQSRTGTTKLRTLSGRGRCQGGALPPGCGGCAVGEAGVEPAQPKRPVYRRVFSPHDQLALGVPDGYCPRSCPGHSRAPHFLGPGTSRPGRCRTCCLRRVKAAL